MYLLRLLSEVPAEADHVDAFANRRGIDDGGVTCLSMVEHQASFHENSWSSGLSMRR